MKSILTLLTSLLLLPAAFAAEPPPSLDEPLAVAVPLVPPAIPLTPMGSDAIVIAIDAWWIPLLVPPPVQSTASVVEVYLYPYLQDAGSALYWNGWFPWLVPNVFPPPPQN